LRNTQPPQSGTRRQVSEAKNAGICRLFGLSDDSTKGCRYVLHPEHIIRAPGGARRAVLLRGTVRKDGSSSNRSRGTRPAHAKGRSITAAAFLIETSRGWEAQRLALPLSRRRGAVTGGRRRRPTRFHGGLRSGRRGWHRGRRLGGRLLPRSTLL